MATPKRKPYDWLQKPQQPAPYTPGQSVQDAQKAYQGIAGQKPGDYVSQYQNRMTELYDKINNRQAFNYDVNADALYQQYKDQYQRMGKTAMQDTMGQAQAMTGGYGSTYAQTVGNQAYQGHLQRLNEMVPQLEQRAFDRYQGEGQDLYNQYSLAADADATDYGRYQDAYSQWLQQQQQAYSQYADERGFDYGAYRDAMQQSNWQQQFAYGQERDAVADSQWQQGFNFNRERANVADSQWQQGFDYGKQRDQAADNKWQAQFDYGKERDQTADSQWREAFDYSKYRDDMQQQNWQSQFDYGKQRDTVADSQWRDTFEYGKDRDAQQQANWREGFDYGKYQDAIQQANWNKQFEYGQQRDQVGDARWQTQFDYGKQQDAQQQSNLDRQFAYGQERDMAADSRWDQQFAYGQQQDAQQQSNWQQTFDQSKALADQQQQNWQSQFDYGKQVDAMNQSNWNKQFEYGQEMDQQQQANWEYDRNYREMSDQQKQDFGLAMAAIQGGQVPSADLLKAAGIDPGTAKLLANLFKPKATGGGSGGKSGADAPAFDANSIINTYKEGGTKVMDQALEGALRDGSIKPDEAAAYRQFIVQNVPYTKNYMSPGAPPAGMDKFLANQPASMTSALSNVYKPLNTVNRDDKKKKTR